MSKTKIRGLAIFIVIANIIAMIILVQTASLIAEAQTCSTIMKNPPDYIFANSLAAWRNIVSHSTTGCKIIIGAKVKTGHIQFTAVSSTTPGIDCNLQIDGFLCQGVPATTPPFIEAVMKSNANATDIASLETNLDGATSTVTITEKYLPPVLYLPIGVAP